MADLAGESVRCQAVAGVGIVHRCNRAVDVGWSAQSPKQDVGEPAATAVNGAVLELRTIEVYKIGGDIMQEVSVSELRSRLPDYLARAELGEEILVTRRGRVIARLTAAYDLRNAAKLELRALRQRARIGDVVSPVGESWEVE